MGFRTPKPGRTCVKYYFYVFIFKNNARQETLEHAFCWQNDASKLVVGLTKYILLLAIWRVSPQVSFNRPIL